MSPDSPPPSLPGENITAAEVASLGLFSCLDTAPDLAHMVGGCRLVRLRPDQSLELPPAMAVYWLTRAEVYQLKLDQLRSAQSAYQQVLEGQPPPGHSADTRQIQQQVEDLSDVVAEFDERSGRHGELQQPAAAMTVAQRPAEEPRPGLLKKIFGGRTEPPPAKQHRFDVYPADVVDAASMPGPGMLIARDRGFVFLFPRRLYRALSADFGYRAEVERREKERGLALRLSGSPPFRTLDNLALQRLAETARWKFVDPGDVLCDAGASPRAAWLVQSGGVECFHASGALIAADDIKNWPALCQELLAGKEESSS